VYIIDTKAPPWSGGWNGGGVMGGRTSSRARLAGWLLVGGLVGCGGGSSYVKLDQPGAAVDPATPTPADPVPAEPSPTATEPVQQPVLTPSPEPSSDPVPAPVEPEPQLSPEVITEEELILVFGAEVFHEVRLLDEFKTLFDRTLDGYVFHATLRTRADLLSAIEAAPRKIKQERNDLQALWDARYPEDTRR